MTKDQSNFIRLMNIYVDKIDLLVLKMFLFYLIKKIKLFVHFDLPWLELADLEFALLSGPLLHWQGLQVPLDTKDEVIHIE